MFIFYEITRFQVTKMLEYIQLPKTLWFSNDPKYKKSHLLIDIYVHVR